VGFVQRVENLWNNPPPGPSIIGAAKSLWDAFKTPGEAMQGKFVGDPEGEVAAATNMAMNTALPVSTKAITAPAATAVLNPEDVIQAGAKSFQSPAVKSVLISPGPVQNLSDNILDQLSKAKLNDRLAPQTRAIVGDLATPVNGPLHTMEDYQTTRQLLGKVAGNYSNPIEQTAASKAIDLLDQGFNNIPQSALVSGDIGTANNALMQGRGDYAAGMAAQRIQQKLDNAELQAASAHSGGNIDNATRQKLRTVLTSPNQSRGLTPDELDQIDQVVRGSPTGNVLRATGKMLGGGGGLGSLVSAAEGMHVAGPIGATMPLLGFGVKKAGDALTTAAANKAVQQILSRAPSAPTLSATAPAVPGFSAALLTAPSRQISPLAAILGQFAGPSQQLQTAQ
jgi:hypothetical protein